MEEVCDSVNERMRHLNKWERQQGLNYVWGPNESMIDRNKKRLIDLVCRYEGCGTGRQKSIHSPIEEKARF